MFDVTDPSTPPLSATNNSYFLIPNLLLPPLSGGFVLELVGGGQRGRQPCELQGEGGGARGESFGAGPVRELPVLRRDSPHGQESRGAEGE